MIVKQIKVKYALSASDAGTWGAEANEDDGIVVIRSTEIDLDGRIRLVDPAIRSLSGRERRRTQLAVGDLLVVKSSGSDSHLGKVGIVDTQAKGMSFSNFTQRLRVKESFEPRFVWYFLNSLEAKRQVRRISSTTTGLQNLSAGTIGEILLPLFNLEAQCRIADFLDTETAKVSKVIVGAVRQSELLKARYFASVQSALMHGVGPTEAQRTDLGWLPICPSHWNLIRLRYLTECLDSKRIPLSAEQRASRSGDYPYYGASGIVDYVDNFLFNESLVLLGEDGAKLGDPHYMIASHVQGKIWVNNHAHVLRSTGIDGRLLAHILNVFDRELCMSGSTREKITQDAMKAIVIPVPPEREQRELVEQLSLRFQEQDTLRDMIQRQIALLADRRQALITAAVTGQIDVTTARGTV